jgi:zinc transport system permease protein
MGEDSAIGIMLVVAMVVGVILLDVRAEWVRRLSASGEMAQSWMGYTPSFHDILFGNILSISRSEVWVACGVAAAVLLWVSATFKGLVFCAVDEEAASTFGVPTSYLHYGLLTALGITIVVAMRLLGVILVTALLVLPGIIGSLWSRRILGVLAVSVAAALLSIVLGLVVAMEIRVLSTGPVIVIVLALLFLGSWLASGRK